METASPERGFFLIRDAVLNYSIFLPSSYNHNLKYHHKYSYQIINAMS